LKAVVDTNVIAYLLLGPEQYLDEARGFARRSVLTRYLGSGTRQCSLDVGAATLAARV
jgi:hypothetical protein